MKISAEGARAPAFMLVILCLLHTGSSWGSNGISLIFNTQVPGSGPTVPQNHLEYLHNGLR